MEPLAKFEASDSVKFWVAKVKSKMQLRKVIRSTVPELREAVYNMIAPHLPFKAPAFKTLLKKF